MMGHQKVTINLLKIEIISMILVGYEDKNHVPTKMK
jgi:hypothetical protein